MAECACGNCVHCGVVEADPYGAGDVTSSGVEAVPYTAASEEQVAAWISGVDGSWPERQLAGLLRDQEVPYARPEDIVAPRMSPAEMQRVVDEAERQMRAPLVPVEGTDYVSIAVDRARSAVEAAITRSPVRALADAIRAIAMMRVTGYPIDGLIDNALALANRLDPR